MININPKFESNPMNLREELPFTEMELKRNLEELRLQKARLEDQIAELELKYAGKEYSNEDEEKRGNAETLLMMLNEAIREAEELISKK